MTFQNSKVISRLFDEFRGSFTKDIRIYFTYPTAVIGDAISIPLWFVLFVLAGITFDASAFTTKETFQHAVSFFFWGFVFITLLSTNLSGLAQYLTSEQAIGVLEQIFLTPASRVAIVAGRWARVMVTDLIVLATTTLFLFAVLRTPLIVENPIAVFLLLATLEIGLLGAGMILAGLSLRIKSIASYANYAWLAVMILCGVFYPPSSLPQPLETISLLLPPTYFADLIKHFAVGTQTIIPVTSELGLDILFAFVFFIAGLFVFFRMERLAKRQGTLAFT